MSRRFASVDEQVRLRRRCARRSVALAARRCAQEAPSLRAHRFTISGGLVWSGGYDIGDATAQLRGNGAGAIGAAVHAVHGGFARHVGDRRPSCASASR